MMKKNESELHKEIREILSSQRLAVLATERNGQPYSSLMAFAHSSDLSVIGVATGMATRKHINLLQESRVSLLIDTRTNSEADFHKAAAVTAIGKAELVQEKTNHQLCKIYLDKHPYLDAFLSTPSTSFFKISIQHYLIVNRFQNVMEYHLTDETDIFT